MRTRKRAKTTEEQRKIFKKKLMKLEDEFQKAFTNKTFSEILKKIQKLIKDIKKEGMIEIEKEAENLIRKINRNISFINEFTQIKKNFIDGTSDINDLLIRVIELHKIVLSYEKILKDKNILVEIRKLMVRFQLLSKIEYILEEIGDIDEVDNFLDYSLSIWKKERIGYNINITPENINLGNTISERNLGFKIENKEKTFQPGLKNSQYKSNNKINHLEGEKTIPPIQNISDITQNIQTNILPIINNMSIKKTIPKPPPLRSSPLKSPPLESPPLNISSNSIEVEIDNKWNKISYSDRKIVLTKKIDNENFNLLIERSEIEESDKILDNNPIEQYWKKKRENSS